VEKKRWKKSASFGRTLSSWISICRAWAAWRPVAPSAATQISPSSCSRSATRRPTKWRRSMQARMISLQSPSALRNSWPEYAQPCGGCRSHPWQRREFARVSSRSTSWPEPSRTGISVLISPQKNLSFSAIWSNMPIRQFPIGNSCRRYWGPEYGDQVDYLRVFIKNLRKKVELDPENPEYITTEPWFGYRFNGTPERA